jgi:hypothetical protein
VGAAPLRSGLAATAFVAVALLASAPTTAALTCAQDWNHPLAAAGEAVAGERAGWSGLLVGTISAAKAADDYSSARELVVEPAIVFAGTGRERLHVSVGAKGPDLSFDRGDTYFLALQMSNDPEISGWLVDPCGPTFKLTSPDQVAELRALTDDEVIVAAPQIDAQPTTIWFGAALAGAAAAAVWLLRRQSRIDPVD